MEYVIVSVRVPKSSPCIVWTLGNSLRYRVHKSPSLVPLQSQINPFEHSFTARTNVLLAKFVDRTDTTLLKFKFIFYKDNQQ
jgi:hypothetical protein